jgi:hypothetical protein
MKKPQNEIQLILAGPSTTMSLILTSSGKVETRFGKRSDGLVQADKTKSKIIFKLAEIVLLDARKRRYLKDSAWSEIAGLRIVARGKRTNYSFQNASAPPMPGYLRLLAIEMAGLTKW